MQLISVIVPVYNVEKFLIKCLESIVNQTYKDLEIILVDDGSTDTSGTICDAYKEKDNRIKVIHKKNEGLSEARNTGLMLATGDYISFIDSDDFIELDMYTYLISNMQKVDADIGICGTFIDYEDGKSITKNNSKEEVLNNKEALIKLNSFSSFDMAVWNKLYKKKILENIKFPFGKKSEDYFVMYRYFDRAKKVVVLPKCKYHYFQRKNSISRSKKISYDYIEGSKQQKDFFEKNYTDISFVANTAYAFSYIATYNHCIGYNIKLDKEKKKLFKTEVKEYLSDVINNIYISSSKKMQAILFSRSLTIYKIIMKIINIKR